MSISVGDQYLKPEDLETFAVWDESGVEDKEPVDVIPGGPTFK